ncbi:phenylalanine ammonia-lyase [Periconia macrospinosa]|uniref:Phenylalanine ammonia-lyase n=1 Tax=Periconia macrospinosa TaxID=97972 RepID=A0A2V1DDH0_9PLEO|nr:phenylalanine ammonia-lyase [Periconia macrospinosa]
MELSYDIASPALTTTFRTWQRVTLLRGGGGEVFVDGRTLDIGAVAAVAYHGCVPKLSTDPHLLERMDASVKILMNQLHKGYFVYAGVNTGFGGSADTRTDRLVALQAALLQHTQAGVLVAADRSDGSHDKGPSERRRLQSHAMPAPWVRAATIVRCNSTVKGHSAVSPEVTRSLLELLKHGITPVVPLRGSLSASGDLMPLSYIAGAIEGSPDIYVQVQNPAAADPPVTMTARDALLSVRMSPRAMGPKEGLCIVNGTSSSVALAALVMFESHMLSVLVQALSGMAVEALMGSAESFHPFISAVRPHGGQIECSRNVLQLLQGSLLVQNVDGEKDHNRSGLVQDRYALRSVPQWIGPQLEDLHLAHRQVTTELNSSCDNPLVDAESDDVYYGCNFQAASVTSAMEKARTALQMLGKLVFAQSTEMIEPHLNNGLPTNLAADNPNLSFTMKGVDTNMAAYMAELAYLAHPVSSHVQAAEMHNQSVNSMAFASSRFTMDAVEVLSIMCACHLYVGCQALDLRALHLRFLNRAFETLRALNAQVFLYATETELSQLNGAIKAHLTDTWPKTNTLAIEERCRVTAKTALDSIVAVFSQRGHDEEGPRAYDLVLWTERATYALSELYMTTVERFAQDPHTIELLGTGSRALYKTVRQTLGVPFHRGLVEHPTIESSELHGREKKTIGSWISIIYESIRTTQLFGPLMDVLGTTALVG